MKNKSFIFQLLTGVGITVQIFLLATFVIAKLLILATPAQTLFNSSHPSADCSRHLDLPSLFPAPTILSHKNIWGFYVIYFCSGNSRGVLYFEFWGMMS